MMRLENINKYYNKNKRNEIHVLNDINLNLEDKGFVTILGPSGSGKTTLLNIISGLDKGLGYLYYNDKRYNLKHNQLEKIRLKNFGYIFQNNNLILNLSVYDNLKMILENYNLKEEEKNNIIDNTLKDLNIHKFRKRKLRTLSGGEKQRVAIARCLITNSKIIFADEPTGSLDNKNSLLIMDVLSKLSNDKLIILVTHNTNLALNYSDRIIELKDGKVIKDYQNDLKNTIKFHDKTKININNLNKEFFNNNNLKINYYYDNLDSKINMDLIFNKNKLLIKSSQMVTPLENSGINLINDDNEYIEINNTYNINNNNNVSYKKNNIFKAIFITIKNTTIEFFKYGFKKKILFFVLFLLGIFYVTNTFLLNYYFKKPNEEKIKELYLNNEIDILNKNNKLEFKLPMFKYSDYYNINYNSYSYSFGFGYIDNNKNNIIYTNDKINDDEEFIMYIDLNIINRIISIYNNQGINSYKDFNYSKINFNGIEYKFKGVIDSDSYNIYIPKNYDKYFNYYNNKIYIGNDNTNTEFLNISKEEAFDILYSKDSIYKLNNKDIDIKNLKPIKYQDYLLKEAKLDIQSTKDLIIRIIILSILLVSIYFIMRSRIIENIKTLGIKRTIGFTKSKIYLSEIIYIIIITTFSSLIGYLLMMRVFNKLFEFIKTILISYKGISGYSYFLGILIMYLINIIIGLLPSILLLRKTPIEILQKYDI